MCIIQKLGNNSQLFLEQSSIIILRINVLSCLKIYLDGRPGLQQLRLVADHLQRANAGRDRPQLRRRPQRRRALQNTVGAER